MATVHFLPVEKFRELGSFLRAAGLAEFGQKDEPVCLKIHFGETTHSNAVPPRLLAELVGMLKDRGVRPCLVDTNVLYRGQRATTLGHLHVAWTNNYHTLGIPILIAGGLNADDEVTVPVTGVYERAQNPWMRSGKRTMFLTLEDAYGLYECVCFES